MSFCQNAWIAILGLISITPAFAAITLPATPAPELKASETRIPVIVKLKGDSIANYRGTLPGFPATNNGESRLDFNSPAVRGYEALLNQNIEQVVSKNKIPVDVINYRYTVVGPGFSAVLTERQIDALKKDKNVEWVVEDELLELSMDRSPFFVGATDVWTDQGYAGEGVIVALLDSGIWPESPSFSDPDPLGTPYANPPPRWTGRTCDFSGGENPGAPFNCNNKLIGARTFLATRDLVCRLIPTTPSCPILGNEFTSTRDSVGHGSHVAGTSAGNIAAAASYGSSPALAFVSGIAPRAHVAVYRVCWPRLVNGSLSGACYTGDSAAAAQQAIRDGVDVISFSVGGGTSPYTDLVSLAYFDAYAAGVFVAAAGGNAGAGSGGVGPVNHLAPWITTVAATQHDRLVRWIGSVTLTADGADPLTLTGISATGDVSGPVMRAADVGDADCAVSAEDGAFKGKIVVCPRSSDTQNITRTYNALRRGAIGVIFPGAITVKPYFLPAISADAAQLNSFLSTYQNVSADLRQGETREPRTGDVMASFSSRGNRNVTFGVNKPDLGAPGVSIFASVAPEVAVPPPFPRSGVPPLYEFYDGTSMATPHVAGAAAVLKHKYPSWTPGRIKSALMTSANPNVVRTEAGGVQATPYDVGSGRLDVLKASAPGITFDVPANDYLTFRNALWQTNYPSLYLYSFGNVINVPRRMRKETDSDAPWTVSVAADPGLTVNVTPSSFQFGGAQELPINFEVRQDGLNPGQVAVARVTMTNGQETVLFPINVARHPYGYSHSCEPTTVAVGQTINCTAQIRNADIGQVFTPRLQFQASASLPNQLEIVPGSVINARQTSSRSLIAGSTLSNPGMGLDLGSAPFAYIDLETEGVKPISFAGSADDVGVNITLPAGSNVIYDGRTYTRFGFTTNGYIQFGGLSGTVTAGNTRLPNNQSPVTMAAPFWTDLHVLGGDGQGYGRMYAGVVNRNGADWAVLQWKEVGEFEGPADRLYSFEIVIKLNGPQEIYYLYDRLDGVGANGNLTVGAQNQARTLGVTYYYNGDGVLPVAGETALSLSPSQPFFAYEYSYRARAVASGSFSLCADLQGNTIQGTVNSCVEGQVTP